MDITFRKEKSENGFSLPVLKSGLQKAVRRGDTVLALNCAYEFLSFEKVRQRDSKRVTSIMSNFLHRLMIIFMEDVGQENTWPLFHALWKKSSSIKTRVTERNTEAVYKWVAGMCQLPKSRMCSHARAAALHFLHTDETDKDLLNTSLAQFVHKDINLPLTMYQYVHQGVKHNTRFGTLSMWMPHELMHMWEVRHHQIAVQWAKELMHTREAFLCWMLPLLAFVRGGEQILLISQEIEYKWPDGEVFKMPSYVFDMHVSGKRTSQGYLKFLEEGSHVENEDSTRICTEWKKIYNNAKRRSAQLLQSDAKRKAEEQHIKNVKKSRLHDDVKITTCKKSTLETHAYRFEARTQLVTSRYKTDVYFARNDQNERVVVKGPLKKLCDAVRVVRLAEWKKQHGLPYVNAKVVFLIPDRWPEGTPLGLRNSIASLKHAPFLIMDSVIPTDVHIDVKKHSSKRWPVTDVVDWDKLVIYRWKPMEETDTAKLVSWVISVLCRYVHKIPDFADRNFMVDTDNCVVSLDEDAQPSDNINLMTELKKKRCELACRVINKHWPEIQLKTNTWGVSEIQTKNGVLKLFTNDIHTNPFATKK